VKQQAAKDVANCNHSQQQDDKGIALPPPANQRDASHEKQRRVDQQREQKIRSREDEGIQPRGPEMLEFVPLQTPPVTRMVLAKIADLVFPLT